MGAVQKNYHNFLWFQLIFLFLKVTLLRTLDVPVQDVNISKNNEIRDFLAVNFLPDGEMETRVVYKGVVAKEISAGEGTSGVHLRQILKSQKLLQLIYDTNNKLQDCEYLHLKKQTSMFLLNFKNDLRNLLATSNITVKSLDESEPPEDILEWLHFKEQLQKCRGLHLEMKNLAMKSQHNNFNKTRFSSSLKRSKRAIIFPGTQWCGHSNKARKYTHLGLWSETDKCCRKHDYCKVEIPSLTMKWGFYNMGLFTLSHCRCNDRSKRGLDDLLRIPGTRWCGKGYSADKYTRLGMFSRTDKCCRKHDTSCPFWIGAFETKYGLFNWRVNTLMHCSCDERFRACLKMVGTSDANIVGNLFFNYVQSQCFTLKAKKKCTKRTWWGKCEKHRFIKRAVLRKNMHY